MKRVQLVMQIVTDLNVWHSHERSGEHVKDLRDRDSLVTFGQHEPPKWCVGAGTWSALNHFTKGYTDKNETL